MLIVLVLDLCGVIWLVMLYQKGNKKVILKVLTVKTYFH